MVTQFSCTCGNTDPKKVHEYDGMLGYEALVCTECGRYSDHMGEHAADEWSKHYLQPELKTLFAVRAVEMEGTYKGYKKTYLFNARGEIVSIYPAGQSQPSKRRKSITHNCFRYNLIWK
jgi:hypothetical protein